MCGIAGIIYKNNKKELLAKTLQIMANSIIHRGPDDEGYLLVNNNNIFIYGGNDTPRVNKSPSYYPKQAIEQAHTVPAQIGFAHRRLSIIDLNASGHQPMSYENGKYWIIFNGEVYNYIEIKKVLEKKGYKFISTSDTEVILASYVEWGESCVKQFTGMFSFAIYNTDKREIFMARDPFGIKPLYYYSDNEIFAFASEIKALLTIEKVSRIANNRNIYSYINNGECFFPEETMFEEIKQFPLASTTCFSLSSVNLNFNKYWEINPESSLQNISYSDAVEKTRNYFLKNISLHLRSDVPLGVSLSGGIDSTSIISSVRNIQQQTDLSSFSYISDYAKKSEEKWIDIVGHSVSAKMYKTTPKAGDLIEHLQQLIYTQDEPFGSTSMYAQYRVFKLVQENGIKVMLNGQGADEFLAGYPHYYAHRMHSLINENKYKKMLTFAKFAVKNANFSFMELLGFTLLQHFSLNVKKLQNKLYGLNSGLNYNWLNKRNIIEKYQSEKYNTTYELKKRLLLDLFTNSLPTLLRYEDRNSMAHSIESRVPFLTTDFVEHIMSLPENYILSDKAVAKGIFRDAMKNIIPSAIRDRTDKVGFETPDQKWFETLRPTVNKIIKSDIINEIPILNQKQIISEWENVANGRKKYDLQIWRWINLIKWVKMNNVKFV